MKALLRTYEKLPLRKKVKIVVLFPILIIATAVDKIVDMFANMLEWLWGPFTIGGKKLSASWLL